MLSGYIASVTSRLEIWHNSFWAWLDAPFFGHGLGAFEQAYAPHRADHQWFMDGSVMASPYVTAGMAHNAILQSLMELGLFGTVLVVMFVAKMGITIPILVGLAMAMIEFPEQNPATAMMLACAFGMSRPCLSSALHFSRRGGAHRGRFIGYRRSI